MKTLRMCLVAILVIVVAVVLFWPESNSFSELLWRQKQLVFINDQLDGISVLLQTYKAEHGDYPNMEGGLKLSRFDTMQDCILSGAATAKKRCHNIDCLLMLYEHGGEQIIKNYIREFREHNDRTPNSWSELFNMQIFQECNDDISFNDRGQCDYDIAICEPGRLYLIDNGYIMTPWQLPYFYENRRNLDPAIFSQSPASRDKYGDYSVRVDDGIFVYSAMGEWCAKPLRLLYVKALTPRVISAVVLLVVIICMIKKRAKYKYHVFFVVVFTAIILWFIVHPYFMGHADGWCWYFKDRPSEIREQQVELLKLYAQEGVIDTVTYNDLLAILDDWRR